MEAEALDFEPEEDNLTDEDGDVPLSCTTHEAPVGLADQGP